MRGPKKGLQAYLRSALPVVPYAAVVALLVLVGATNAAVSFRSLRSVAEDERWVSHTHEVQAALGDVLNSLLDAETGQRGYLVTGSPAYLEPYEAGVQSLRDRLQRLQVLTKDNPAQQRRIESILPLIQAKLTELQHTISLRQNASSPAAGDAAARAVVASGDGKRLMDELRAKIGEARAAEGHLLEQRKQTSERALQAAHTSSVGSLLGSLVLLAGAVVLLVRLHNDNQNRALAAEGLRLRATVASIGDAVIVTDREGRITLLNGVAQKLMGCGDEATGRPLEEVFHIVNEQTRQPIENPVARVLRMGAVVGLANRTVLLAQDGAETAIDDSGAPIRDSEGRTIGVVLVFRDVTEHRRAELGRGRLATIVSNSDDAIISEDLNGTMLTWNPGAERLFGYRPEEVIGRSIAMLLSPDRPHEEADILRRLLAGERIEHFETVRLTKDKTQVDVSVTVSPVKDAEGLIVGVSNIARDITDRKKAEATFALAREVAMSKRAEEVLSKSAEEFRQLAEAMPQIVWVTRADGWNIYFNQRWVDYTGLTLDESYGHGWNTPFHPEDRQRAWDAWQNATKHGATYSLECRLRRADGKYRWWLVRGVPFVDSTGEVQKWFGTCTDIDDLKRTEETRQLANLLKMSGDAILVRHPNRRIEAWSRGAEALYGFTVNEALGQEPEKLLRTRFPRPLKEIEAEAHEKGWWEGELVHTAKDGRTVTVSAKLQLIRSDDGAVRMLQIDRDLSARKRAEQALRAANKQLRDANRELTEFAAIASHDLKAPLRAVATLASWTQSDYADRLDDEGRQNLAEMVKRVARLDQMIDGVLEYSRVGREQGHPESIPLAEVVESVVQDLAPPDNIHVAVAPGLPVVQGLSVRLRQVFQNLLSNAIKYRDKPHAEISVEWADRETEWEFLVADNGPGIEERHFERIFGMFQTLAPKDRTDSTGVGLALVKRIVERQPGGRVWVTSRPGQGSTFHFTWPKAPPAATHGQAREPRALERTGEGTSEADHGRA